MTPPTRGEQGAAVPASREDAFDHEQVYDEQIAPLMAQVIAICQKHRMPLMASVTYAHGGDTGDGVQRMCTTFLTWDGRNPRNYQAALTEIDKRPTMAAFTITKETP